MQFGNTELNSPVLEIGYGTSVRNARDGKLCKEHCRRPQAGRHAYTHSVSARLVVNSQTAHKLAYRCRPDLRSKAVQVIQVMARTMDRERRFRVIRVGLAGPRRLPVYPGEQTFSG